MPKRDPHDILGVEPGASPTQIKAAWRRLARTHHPDLTGDDPAASRVRDAAHGRDQRRLRGADPRRRPARAALGRRRDRRSGRGPGRAGGRGSAATVRERGGPPKPKATRPVTARVDTTGNVRPRNQTLHAAGRAPPGPHGQPPLRPDRLASPAAGTQPCRATRARRPRGPHPPRAAAAGRRARRGARLRQVPRPHAGPGRRVRAVVHRLARAPARCCTPHSRWRRVDRRRSRPARIRARTGIALRVDRVVRRMVERAGSRSRSRKRLAPGVVLAHRPCPSADRTSTASCRRRAATLEAKRRPVPSASTGQRSSSIRYGRPRRGARRRRASSRSRRGRPRPPRAAAGRLRAQRPARARPRGPGSPSSPTTSSRSPRRRCWSAPPGRGDGDRAAVQQDLGGRPRLDVTRDVLYSEPNTIRSAPSRSASTRSPSGVAERPTSTDGRHIGSVRKRSITPLERSVDRPTAVPIDDVVRLSASTGDREVRVAPAVRQHDPAPNTYTNSTVKSTGWTVTSESCSGSRAMWTRLRPVSTAMSRSRPAMLLFGGRGWWCSSVGTSRSSPALRRTRRRRSRRPWDGQGEEHVVE